MDVQKDGSVLFAVYGTLRKGCHNRHYLGNAKLLGTTKTNPEYTMYNRGGFPIVCPGGNTSIVIEVYKTSDPSVIDNINRLEGYTGVRGNPLNWYDTCSVATPYGDANMFIQNKVSNNLPIIESGDWVNK